MERQIQLHVEKIEQLIINNKNLQEEKEEIEE